jgi:hypothetical protein
VPSTGYDGDSIGELKVHVAVLHSWQSASSGNTMVVPQLTLPSPPGRPSATSNGRCLLRFADRSPPTASPYPFAGVNSRWRFVRPWRK